jgi:hypothetical protein
MEVIKMLNNLKSMLNTNKYMGIDPWEEYAREMKIASMYYPSKESNIITYENESDIFDDEDEE